MILHFSHIGFTDGRTFMILFQFFARDPAPGLWRPRGRRYPVAERVHATEVANRRDPRR
jgi:hypothetical protein